MRFWKVGSNQGFTRGNAWAWRVTNERDEEELRCACGAVSTFGRVEYPRRLLEVEVEGGVRYPDVLGNAEFLLIVSEAVLDDWRRGGVTGYRAHPLRIASAKGKRIQEVKPPVYHHIEVTGRCELDLDAMGVTIVSVCPLCGYWKLRPMTGVPFVVKPGTWDGSDLFASAPYWRAQMCTDKVLRLAGENRRTNFRFVPLEKCGDPQQPTVDYMKEARRMAREEAKRSL